MKANLTKYEESFELKVSEQGVNCADVRAFNITKKMVWEWRNNEGIIRKMLMNKCAMKEEILIGPC